MALDMKLSIGLRQKLVLTPALQQAIRLLQLNRIELLQEIHQELLQNPTLEEVISDQDGNQSSETEKEEKISEENSSSDDEELPDNPNPRDEVEWEKYFQDDDITEREYKNYDYSDFVFADNFVNKKNTLKDHLIWQTGLLHLSNEDEEITQKIIEYIDEDGYLWNTNAELSEDLGLPEQKIQELVDVIQDLDPAGVGARNLKECLLNQIIMLRREFLVNLKYMGIQKSDIDNAEKIIENYLSHLENKNYEIIQNDLQLDSQEIERALKAIQSLEPKPGRLFYPESPSYILPDVFVIEDNEDYIVLLNDDGIPKLRLSDFYTNVAKDRINVSKEAKKFVEQKLHSAMWFIKSIEQRKQTILNVAKQIVENQKEFMKIGLDGLKPMTLHEIANKLAIHESTVSRVVNNKYIHTPRGIYEMKFFFHGGIIADNGVNISTIVIKNMIANLIRTEDPQYPLNDNDIANSLKEKGIEIARRTIAKYRESLNIVSSSQRKKEYNRKKTSN
jgi:RNA polymerase sigma-54 factor